MRILEGITSVDINDVIPNLGGLYQYPYPVILRNEENEVIGYCGSYDLFVVLDYVKKTSGNYLKILRATGEVGFVQCSPRYLKQIS